MFELFDRQKRKQETKQYENMQQSIVKSNEAEPKLNPTDHRDQCVQQIYIHITEQVDTEN